MNRITILALAVAFTFSTSALATGTPTPTRDTYTHNQNTVNGGDTYTHNQNSVQGGDTYTHNQVSSNASVVLKPSTHISTPVNVRTGSVSGTSSVAGSGNSHQSQGQSTDNANNAAQSVSVNTNVPKPHKNTPDVFMGSPASGPCTGVSGGVGVSVAGFGFGANGAASDVNCSLRELARVATIVGRDDLACLALEQSARNLGLAVVVSSCISGPLTVEAASPPADVVVVPFVAPIEVTPAPVTRAPKAPRG